MVLGVGGYLYLHKPKPQEVKPPVAAGVSQAEAELLDETKGKAGLNRTNQLPLYVYKDSGVRGFCPDGWMGDYSDIRLDEGCKDAPHSGKTCIRVEYKSGASQNCKWAGVYWCFPGNLWGQRRGGYDLSQAKKLVFWIRGEKGGEVLQELKMGGINGANPDSDTAGIGPVELTKEWQKFEIDLTGLNLGYISGGFCWSTNLDRNPEGCTFYLDDIYYE